MSAVCIWRSREWCLSLLVPFCIHIHTFSVCDTEVPAVEEYIAPPGQMGSQGTIGYMSSCPFCRAVSNLPSHVAVLFLQKRGNPGSDLKNRCQCIFLLPLCHLRPRSACPVFPNIFSPFTMCKVKVPNTISSFPCCPKNVKAHFLSERTAFPAARKQGADG